MKRIVITAPHKVKIEEAPMPEPGANEVLVKAVLSGISSGTEMMSYRGTHPNFKLDKWPLRYPQYPGYELAGRVAGMGEGASSAGKLKIGDRVICLANHAEYVCVPEFAVVPIPDHVSFEVATLAPLGTTTMNAVRRSQLEYGETLTVIGMGIVGYLILQHAKLAGARRTICVDIDEKRLEIASKAGADLTINPVQVDPEQAVVDFNEIGSDVVIEASGAPGTFQLALSMLRYRGRVVILGWHTGDIKFTMPEVYYREATIITARAGGPKAGLPLEYVRWTADRNLRLAMDLIAQGKINTEHVNPSLFDFEKINHVYSMIDKRDERIGMQAILVWEK